MRDAPARLAADEAEPLLPVDTVDLVDHAIDVVIEARAMRLDVAVKRDQLVYRAAQTCQRIGVEAAFLKPFNHAGLAVRRHVADLAPGIRKEAERARRGDAGVLLAQGACGGVARIGKDLPAGFLLPLVELQEV